MADGISEGDIDSNANEHVRSDDTRIPFETNLPETFSIDDWVRLLNSFQIQRGLANVAIIGPDPEMVRVANFVLTIFFLKDQNRRLLFETIRIVAPPTWPRDFNVAQVVVEQLLAMGYTEEEAFSHADRVQQYVPLTLCSEALLTHLRTCTAVDIMYVASAADFRYPSSVALTNTTWVAHSIRLAAEMIEYASATDCAVVVDAGRYVDSKRPLCAELEEIPCNIVTTFRKGLKTTKMLQVACNATTENWRSVLGQIDSFQGSCNADFAALLRAIVFHHGEQTALAWKVLAPFADQLVEQAINLHSPRIFIAGIAAKAGDWDVAQRLLAEFDVSTADVESLEEALLVATACDARASALTVVARLQQVYPTSIVLGQYKIQLALRGRNFMQLGLLADDPTLILPAQTRLFWADISIALGSTGADYNALVESLIKKHPKQADAIAIIFAREAELNEAHAMAVKLALLIDANSGDGMRATSLAIRAFGKCLLIRDEDGKFPFSDELLATLIATLAERVAVHPNHPRLRHELAAMLSPETLGTMGIAMTAFLILGRVEELQILEAPGARGTAIEGDTEALRVLLNEIFPQLNVVIIGTGELPGSVSEASAKRICLVLERHLDSLCEQAVNVQSIRTLHLFLYVAVLVCQRAGDEALAANLGRIAAGHLATTGHFQDARDLAEHFLALAQGSRKALRIAWMCYADIYYRLGNRHDAFCGMLLATCFRSEVADIKEAWHEVDIVVRLLRSLGLFAQAGALLTKASEKFGVKSEQHQLRLDYLKLTLYPRDAEHLAELIPRAVLVVTEGIRLKDALPPTIYLVQLINDAKRLGIPVSNQTSELIELARREIPAAFEDLVDAHANLSPTLKDIETTLTGARATRYSDDLAYDLKGATALAKRALVNIEDVSSEDLIALIELLTDRGLVELQERAPIDRQRNKNVIEYLNRNKHQVLMLAVNVDSELVRVTATTTGYQIEAVPREVFSWERFQQWNDEFPKMYSTMDGPSDQQSDSVRASVRQIGIGSSVKQPTAIVADVDLQLLPMNLLQCEGDFLGNLLPVTLIPSLDWLGQLISNPRESNGRIVAWIPDSQAPSQDSGNATLAIMADEWAPFFADNGVSFSRDAAPPAELRDADFAIIAAHGGLVEDKYFHVVADDGHQRWAPKHIGEAIGAAGVAVLFICSGGRLDRSPDARTSIGFVHRLLAGGCQSVVACPWPLAAMVARPWLPVFFDQLKSGSQVSDATFAANKKMSECFSGNPPLALAMHVFGDPTYRLSTHK